MDRFEILKLAMASSKDAKEALALAQQMVDFIEEKPIQVKPPAAPAPVEPPINTAPTNARRKWVESDVIHATALLDQGYTIEQVAVAMKRTYTAIDKAWRNAVFQTERPYPWGRKNLKQAATAPKIDPIKGELP